MVSIIQSIKRAGFPQFLVGPVNELIERENRDWIVKFDSDSDNARFDEDNDQIVLILPKKLLASPTMPTNPYTMLNTGSSPNTDTWPQVNIDAGGIYDGVIVTQWMRTVSGGATSAPLAGMTLSVYPTATYLRGAEWDTDGRLVYVGPEETLTPPLDHVTLA